MGAGLVGDNVDVTGYKWGLENRFEDGEDEMRWVLEVIVY